MKEKKRIENVENSQFNADYIKLHLNNYLNTMSYISKLYVYKSLPGTRNIHLRCTSEVYDTKRNKTLLQCTRTFFQSAMNKRNTESIQGCPLTSILFIQFKVGLCSFIFNPLCDRKTRQSMITIRFVYITAKLVIARNVNGLEDAFSSVTFSQIQQITRGNNRHSTSQRSSSPLDGVRGSRVLAASWKGQQRYTK